MINNQKGITLIEIMAATVILGMLVIGFINLSTFSSKSKIGNDRSVAALQLAEEQLNINRSYYNTLQSDAIITGNKQLTPFPSSIPDNDNYNIIVQLSDLIENPTYTQTTGNRQVHVQSVVLIKNAADLTQVVPRLLTVTVSWDG
jgi:type II secretory pathway pseudopilin PulG